MKRCDEALNAIRFNFFARVKRFIACFNFFEIRYPPRHPDGLKVIFYDARAKTEAGASFLPLSVGFACPSSCFVNRGRKRCREFLSVVAVVLDLWCKH
jgi:hypothetical protein